MLPDPARSALLVAQDGEVQCPLDSLQRMTVLNEMYESILASGGSEDCARVPVSLRKHDLNVFLAFLASSKEGELEAEDATSEHTFLDLISVCKVANYVSLPRDDAGLRRLGSCLNAYLTQLSKNPQSLIRLKRFKAMPHDCVSFASRAIVYAVAPKSLIGVARSIAPAIRMRAVSIMRAEYGNVHIVADPDVMKDEPMWRWHWRQREGTPLPEPGSFDDVLRAAKLSAEGALYIRGSWKNDQLCALLAQCPDIHELDFRFVYGEPLVFKGRSSILQICHAEMEKMTKVRVLRVRQCLLRKAGMSALKQAVCAMTQLRVLDLGGVMYHGRDSDVLGVGGTQILVAILTHLTALESLVLGDPGTRCRVALLTALTDKCAAMTARLSHLGIEFEGDDDGFTDSEQDIIVDVLGLATRLTSLALNSSPHTRSYDDPQTYAWSEKLTSALQGLAGRLRSLDVRSNNFGLEGVNTMCSHLTAMSRLSSLNLSSNKIYGVVDAEDLLPLGRFVLSMPALRTVIVSFERGAADDAIEYVKSKFAGRVSIK